MGVLESYVKSSVLYCRMRKLLYGERRWITDVLGAKEAEDGRS